MTHALPHTRQMSPLRVDPPKIWRVSQIAAGIKGMLSKVGPGYVEGEVRSINVQASSGHCYLTLADSEATLSAIIWKSAVANCRPLPSQGDLIQAHYTKIDFYAPRGSVSLILDRLRPTGEGELLRRREEVRKRLADEGLTDTARLPAPTVLLQLSKAASRPAAGTSKSEEWA